MRQKKKTKQLLNSCKFCDYLCGARVATTRASDKSARDDGPVFDDDGGESGAMGQREIFTLKRGVTKFEHTIASPHGVRCLVVARAYYRKILCVQQRCGSRHGVGWGGRKRPRWGGQRNTHEKKNEKRKKKRDDKTRNRVCARIDNKVIFSAVPTLKVFAR